MKRKKRRVRSLVSSLSGELTSVMRSMGNTSRTVHPEIWARWLQIAGPDMYKRTFPTFYRGTVLTIGVSSSTWLQELSFLKNTLLDRLEEEVGPGVVTEIKMVLDIKVGKNRIDPYRERPRVKKEIDLSTLDPTIAAAADKIEDPELALHIKKAAAANMKKK